MLLTLHLTGIYRKTKRVPQREETWKNLMPLQQGAIAKLVYGMKCEVCKGFQQSLTCEHILSDI